jgi:hypothetical protein
MAAGGSRKDADDAVDPEQRLYFRPLPQGQGWFRPGFAVSTVIQRTIQPPVRILVVKTGGGGPSFEANASVQISPGEMCRAIW